MCRTPIPKGKRHLVIALKGLGTTRTYNVRFHKKACFKSYFGPDAYAKGVPEALQGKTMFRSSKRGQPRLRLWVRQYLIRVGHRLFVEDQPEKAPEVEET